MSILPINVKEEPQLISSKVIIGLIGLLGLLFPTIVVLFATIKDDLPILNSLSAYYYTSSRDGFVGILCSLAFAFFAYKGYNNKGMISDSFAGTMASIFSLGVAFCPTSTDTVFSSLSKVHYASAILLFLTLAYFCLNQFTRSKGGVSFWKKENRLNHDLYTTQKLNECYFFITCGGAILFCLLLCLAYALNMITYPKTVLIAEVIMIGAFSMSWIIKSNFMGFKE
jgi:hypothetical protein